MKTFVSTALAAHMASPAMTLAWYWIVKRRDRTYFGFTTHVEPLYIVPSAAFGDDMPTLLGHLARSVLCVPEPSFNPTDVAMTASLSQNNLDIEAVLDAVGITDDDIRARKWQAAQFEFGFLNYADVTQGTNIVAMGTLGGSTGGDISVKMELRGLSQPLESNLDGVTSPMCRVAVFSQGPGMCNVDPAPYRRTGTVGTATADRIITDTARTEPDDWWTKGLLTFTSGDANGETFEVKHSTSAGTLELTDEVYYGFAAGDTYSILPGCNKLLKTPGPLDADGNPTYVYGGDCTPAKFDNVVNFQGEPEIVGQIAIQQYGGQTVNDSSS